MRTERDSKVLYPVLSRALLIAEVSAIILNKSMLNKMTSDLGDIKQLASLPGK